MKFLVPSILFISTLAQAGPMTHHIETVTPRAGQRGTTVEVTLEGAYIKTAREVLFYRPGIKCVEVKALASLPEPAIPPFVFNNTCKKQSRLPVRLISGHAAMLSRLNPAA